MNRTAEIDGFLKYYAEIFEKNPNQKITSDTIYSGLATYGMTQEEYNNRDIKYLFDYWIDRYSTISGIEVFHSEQQKRFLQFWNGHHKQNGDYVKLYLNFPKDKMYECVNMIFDFMASKNIQSLSKVSDVIRSDSVVLRIGDINQATLVMDFINSNDYLCYYAKKTNPFLIRNGVVGAAYDGNISYNSAISNLVKEYFAECRSKNDFSKVSASDFSDFITRYKNALLSNPNNLQSFIASTGSLERFSSSAKLVNNYMEVFDLANLSLSANASYADYTNQYLQFSSNINDSRYDKYYDSILNSKVGQVEQNVDAKQVLDNYIKYAIGKYDVDDVHLYLEEYMKGNARSITRDNDFRNLFAKYCSQAEISKITSNDFRSYVASIARKSKEENLVEDFNQFYNACVQTYTKYGTEQLVEALSRALNCDFSHFTNASGNSRKYMIENFNADIIYKCINSLNAKAQEIGFRNDWLANCCNYIESETVVLSNVQNSY